jgi:flavodoxin
MKTLITYYSYTGITEKVAGIFAKVLERKSSVLSQRLKPKKEITSFARQCIAARFGKRCELEEGIVFDIAEYDLLVIGLPVWAFAPAPAINTFLDKLSGLNGKKAIILITSGSGAGVNTCFKTVRKVLEDKGALSIKEINIPNARMKDVDSIILSFGETI